MQRRDFIKGSAVGVLTSITGSFNGLPSNNDSDKDVVVWEGADVPIVFNTDVLIVGGGFSGVAAAMKFTAAGKKVAIIDAKTFLADEVTAYSDYALPIDNRTYPEPIEACKKIGVLQDGHLHLRGANVKRVFEEMLAANGIQLLYNTQPIHIVYNAFEGKYCIVVNSKSGFLAIQTRIIIDCSASSVTGFLLNPDQPTHFGQRVSMTIEMIGIKDELSNPLIVPDSLGILENKLKVTQGNHSDGLWFFEFSVLVTHDLSKGDIVKYNSQILDVRLKAYEIVRHLMGTHPSFANAKYSRLSYYPKHDYVRRTKALPDWINQETSQMNIGIHNSGLKLAEFAGAHPNTWFMPPSKFGYSAILSAVVGDDLGRIIIMEGGFAESRIRKSGSKKERKGRFTLSDRDAVYESNLTSKERVEPFTIPLLASYDILVAGGGTSGATASITSGFEGHKTLVVDGNHGLGGTGTFGGVHGYYNGRRAGFNVDLDWQVRQAEKEIGHMRENNSERWNVEVKNYVLVREAKAAFVDLILYSFVAATLKKGNQVAGVVIVTPFGPKAITSKFVIDATGDGDVAALAGAGYIYGSATNGFTLYSSLGWSNVPGRYNTKFDYMLDVRDPRDVTRNLMANREADKKKSLFDQSTYLTPRETRHIDGLVRLSLTHLLTQQQWSDVINVHFSNVDITGHHSSNWLRVGLLPPNFEVEIPLRALIPKNLENLLVIGKAISADHNVFPAIRMQRDLENLGGGAAFACSLAIKGSCALTAINIKELHKKLIARGVLSPDLAVRNPTVEEYNSAAIPELTEALLKSKPLELYSDVDDYEVFRGRLPFVELWRMKEKAIPYLEQQLRGDADRSGKLLIAKALATMGSNAPVEFLCSQIKDKLKGQKLPERTLAINHTAPSIKLPNQAAMPETAYLLNALALCKDSRSLEIWQEIVEIINASEVDLITTTKGMFYYVDAVCFGCELLGDPRAVPILESLHQNANFNSQSSDSTTGFDSMAERKSVLELEIGAALARSGSDKGYEILISYLEDTRAVLADSSHKTLKRITDKQLPKNRVAWRNWLDKNRGHITPKPNHQLSELF